MSIKCAEIYFSNSGSFTFTCTLCKENFLKAIVIAEHLIDNHFFSIYPDALKSPFLIADNELTTIRELFAIKKEISLEESTGIIEKEVLESIEMEYKKLNSLNFNLEMDDLLQSKPIEKEPIILDEKPIKNDNNKNFNIINNDHITLIPNTINKKISIPHKNMKKVINNYKLKMIHKKYLLKSGNIPNTIYWKCHICKIVMRKGSRSRHMFSMHQCNNLKFNCICCNERFISNTQLQEHIRIHRGGPVERPFQCSECNNKYKILPNLREHIKRAHLKIRNFKCNFCEKKYYSQKEANRHEISFHGLPKPFICEICGIRSTTNQQFKNHVRRHHAEPTFQCNICSKKFHIQRTLTLHQIVHRNEKPYVCKICLAKFPRRSSYRCHMKLHSGMKDYICKLCGKAFVQPSGIRGHMKSHGIKYNAINVIRKSQTNNNDDKESHE